MAARADATMKAHNFMLKTRVLTTNKRPSVEKSKERARENVEWGERAEGSRYQSSVRTKE
jgi:hypothetical protein